MANSPIFIKTKSFNNAGVEIPILISVKHISHMTPMYKGRTLIQMINGGTGHYVDDDYHDLVKWLEEPLIHSDYVIRD